MSLEIPMPPDDSRWQAPATYDFVDDLDAPGVGWEWLRRNEQYQDDYAALTSQADDIAAGDRMASTWGLRFRRRSLAECHADAGVLASRRQYRGRHSDFSTGGSWAIERSAVAA